MSATLRPRNTERGQAMTEFVIAATYVLLPLFIFIPMLGKYIDFKQAAIQAARYQAWEYTVWYENIGDREILNNFNSGDVTYYHPEKTVPQTRQESRIRTMSTVGSYLPDDPSDTSIDAIRAVRSSDAFQSYTPNVLWDDHRGLPFFDGSMDITEVETDDDTPTITIFGVDVGSWLNTIVDVVQTGFDAVAAIINFIDSIASSFQSDPDANLPPGAGQPLTGTAGFSAMHTDGFSHVEFDAVATVPRNVIVLRDDLAGAADASTRDLGFNVKAGVLAAGWNAGGTGHTYLQVGGTTPSTLVNSLLNLPGLSQIWDLISFIAPELSRCDPPGLPDPLVKSPLAAPEGHLWLGYVDGDVVHPDRLSVLGGDPDDRLGTHACDDSGRCTWDDTVLALDPQMSHSPCTL